MAEQPNRHINLFLPYAGPANHEDNLTRAAIVVMRAVPAALDAFLDLTCDRSSDELPACSFDMQTGRLTIGGQVDELVSVFLTPDAEVPGAGRELSVRHSVRRQRVDGVLRFEPDLVVVVESKVYERRSSWQAQNLNFGRLRTRRRRFVPCRWSDLLDRWAGLLDGDALGPAESLVVADLLEMAEEHFPITLSFSSLRRAGRDHQRRLRRLGVVLAEVTGLPLQPQAYRDHVHVRFDGTAVLSTQRVALGIDAATGDPYFGCWLGESNAQTEHVYTNGRARRIVELARNRGWYVAPNPHLSYYQAKAERRCYLTPTVPLDAYVDVWVAERGKPRRERMYGQHAAVEAGDILASCRQQGIANASDEEPARHFFAKLPRPSFYLRAGLRIQRRWAWEEAVRLDDEGRFVPAVTDALIELLDRLDEPWRPQPAV